MPLDDDQPIDPLPSMIAELDQALEMAGQMARMIRSHYEAFVAEGFTERQALYLVCTHLRAPEAPDE